ncbi:hypothetical protein ATANTOWER_000505, partial [Ataeniobius toweri]|nr:hypothetical protein [Ataeniobius toweri]
TDPQRGEDGQTSRGRTRQLTPPAAPDQRAPGGDFHWYRKKKHGTRFSFTL